VKAKLWKWAQSLKNVQNKACFSFLFLSKSSSLLSSLSSLILTLSGPDLSWNLCFSASKYSCFQCYDLSQSATELLFSDVSPVWGSPWCSSIINASYRLALIESTCGTVITAICSHWTKQTCVIFCGCRFCRRSHVRLYAAGCLLDHPRTLLAA